MQSVPDFRPWERAPQESPEEWAAFEDYLYQGPSRSLSKVRSVLRPKLPLIAKNNEWQLRAEYYDSWISRERAISAAKLAGITDELPLLKAKRQALKLKVEITHLTNALTAAERPTTAAEMGPKEIVAALGMSKPGEEDLPAPVPAPPQDLANATVEELETLRKYLP